VLGGGVVPPPLDFLGYFSSTTSSGNILDITPAAIVLPPSLKANLSPGYTGRGKLSFNLH